MGRLLVIAFMELVNYFRVARYLRRNLRDSRCAAMAGTIAARHMIRMLRDARFFACLE